MQRVIGYIKKIKYVGCTQAFRSVRSRFTLHRFAKKWRMQALQKKANHAWSDVVAKERQKESSFAFFLYNYKNA